MMAWNDERCGNCKFFIPLVNTKESYGDCHWFDENEIPNLPWWVNVITDYGSISPNCFGCQTYEALE